MAVFKYRAISLDGVNVQGVIEAYDRLEAVSQIRETCSVVLSVTKVRKLPFQGVELHTGKLPDKLLALMSSQFAINLRAGLPVVRSVELIHSQTNDRRLKEMLSEVAKDVASGYSLAQSLENKGSRLLPATFIETVRAGEESGTLDVSFAKLRDYYDKSAKMKSKVKSAMLYPVFLLILATVVVAIIMVAVMPVFEEMFAGMDMELPGLTRWLMGLSDFFASWWWLIAFFILAFVLAFTTWAHRESGQLTLARIQLKLPALGPVAKMKGASQLANTLSTLLSAGMPLVRSAAITARVLDNRYLGQRLALQTPRLEEGRSLGELLEAEGDFPPMLCEMITLGESSGSLEDTMTTIGAFYDEETAVAAERALSLLQPAITVIMGIVIGVIVVALYLPMFTMYTGM